MKKLISEYPELIKEWHPTKNGELKPEDFTHGNGKKVWWLCQKGHSYDSSCNDRTRKGRPRGCQECKSLDFLFPEISKELHPTKNGKIKPEELSGRSHKKVWWLCPKGHSYSSTIHNRTSKDKKGCPHCYTDRRNSS
jgi:hypothetical protein